MTPTDPPDDFPERHFDVDATVRAAEEARRRIRSRRRLLLLAVPTIITLVWLVFVTATGSWPRVADRWVAAVTMVFGSFVAGSTPQGGGAVAFPVFTKVLAVPAEVARSFSLAIQAVGMSAGAAAILIARRKIDTRAMLLILPPALAGFLVGALTLSRRDRPFMPSLLPGDYLRVTFTVLVVAMALVVLLQFRSPLRIVRHRLSTINGRVATALVGFGFIGGVMSSQVGSGADVLVYALLVATLGVDPPVGVATSVVVMAVLSIVGFITFGLVDGQLSTALDAGGAHVLSVGGQQVGLVRDTVRFGAGGDVSASRYDLYGLWLAAVPIAAWGAPAGGLFAARVKARTLVRFVLVLAVAELVTTIIFLEALHGNIALIAYLVGGTGATVAALLWLGAFRQRIFDLPSASPDDTFAPDRIDAELGFERLLDPDSGGPS